MLVCVGLAISVLMAACAGSSQQGSGIDTSEAADEDPVVTTPPTQPMPPDATPSDATPSDPRTSGSTADLPAPVAQSVLGDHLDDWSVWLELPWADPFLPRCDQLTGSEAACERARTIAAAAEAGELVVLGPEPMEQESLELLVQGLSQLVVVFEDGDEESAEQLTQAIRDVLVGWGAETQDLSIGDASWTADHNDTAPGGFGEIDPELATRMVAVRQGRTVVVLSHADYPENPRLDTQPIARDIAIRLAAAE